MLPRLARRTALVLAGFGLGLAVVLIFVYSYYRTVTSYRLAEEIIGEVELPPGLLRLERLEGDSVAVVALRDVVLRGDDGELIAASPVARFRLQLSSLNGEGPIELRQVRLQSPDVRLVQYPDGSWNYEQALQVSAGGRDVQVGDEEGRGVLLRDVVISGGEVRWLSPWQPEEGAEPMADVRLARVGGVTMRVRTIRDLDARVDVAAFGTPDGWRVDLASANAVLTDPELRIRALAGEFAQAGEGAIRFDVDELRTDRSELAGAGLVRFGEDQLDMDLELVASPLAFADLRWFLPELPAEGEARGEVAIDSRGGGRMAVAARNLLVTADGSTIRGYANALIGGDAPAVFWSTLLEVDPLRLGTLETFGFDVPYEGVVQGTIGAGADAPAAGANLTLDLAATFQPETGDVPPSEVTLQGPVELRTGDAPVRFAGVQVSLQPLYLAALRPLAEGQEENLRGVLTGTGSLEGTPSDFRLAGASLAYEVADAPATRLTSVELQVSTEPQLTFSLDGRADPLALGTISELFPSFPFRSATFTGPVRLSGTGERLNVDVDLAGSAGRIAMRGVILPGDPVGVQLTGELGAFNPQAVLTGRAPIAGPVTGTFEVQGTTRDLRFAVDMAQDTGTFVLEGRMRQVGDTPQFEIAGDVASFNLGALIGRPALFPSRLTGPIRLTGGGREPYRFDVDLTGEAGGLDLEGYYDATGPIPAYAASGTVTGLNLRQLPFGETLPPSQINAGLSVAGEGTTLETLAGQLRLNAGGSTVAGLPLTELIADLTVREGVLVVDTLGGRLGGTRLSAEGSWGLTRPVESPLVFRLVAQDLEEIGPLLTEVPGLEPRVDGAFVLQGALSGSVRRPEADVALRAQGLRYEGYRVRALEMDLDAAMGGGIDDLAGEMELTATDLVLPGGTSFPSIRLALNGNQDRLGVNLALTRPDDADIAAAGILELEGRIPRGVTLDTLAVRAAGSSWRLADPAQLWWGGVEGVRVSNLALERVDGQPGWIRVSGAIPPEGTADLSISVYRFDLGIARRFLPQDPELSGLLSFDALVEGPVGGPEVTLDGRIHQLGYRGVAADSAVVAIRYDDRVLATNAHVWQGPLRVANAELSLPMVLEFDGAVPSFELLEDGAIEGQMVSDSLPLGLLAAGLPTIESADGVISGRMTASGTVSRPRLQGWARVARGSILSEPLGVRYTGIAGDLRFDGERVQVDSLVVRSEGTAIVNGTIRLTELTAPDVHLTARLNGFRAIENDELADLTISGHVALSGKMPEPVLTGAVTLEEGTIYMPAQDERIELEITDVEVGEIGADTVGTAAIEPTLAQRIPISDLQVNVQEGVWIEMDESRVEIRGEMVLFRRAGELQIYGALQAVRGSYQLAIGPLVREFDVVSGSVRFFGTGELNPEIDITAVHEVRSAAGTGRTTNLPIVVRVTGTAEHPRVALTSNTRPPLPESELLNYLVFGQPSFRLSQQGQLASQFVFQEVLGGLLAQELDQIGLPCEYLRLRGRPTEFRGGAAGAFGATSVECGVQLISDVFLTLETGIVSAAAPGNPLGALLGVSVDWEVNEFVTARAAREPVITGLQRFLLSNDIPYQWSVDVTGTWEFAKPRNQPAMDLGAPPGDLLGETAVPVPPLPTADEDIDVPPDPGEAKPEEVTEP